MQDVKSRSAGHIFFALLPDEASTARRAGLAAQIQGGVGLVARVTQARFHVSLHPIGRFPDLHGTRQSKAAGGDETLLAPIYEAFG